jgi:hypothetical protein
MVRAADVPLAEARDTVHYFETNHKRLGYTKSLISMSICSIVETLDFVKDVPEPQGDAGFSAFSICMWVKGRSCKVLHCIPKIGTMPQPGAARYGFSRVRTGRRTKQWLGMVG